MEIRNSDIMSPLFWKSFNKLMTIEKMEVEDKMNLVRLKRYMADEIEVIKDTCKGMEINSPDLLAVMSGEQVFDVSIKLKAEDLAEHVTAEDLFQLEPILTEEES